MFVKFVTIFLNTEIPGILNTLYKRNNPKKIDYDEQFNKCSTEAVYVCRKPCATV